MKPMPVLLCLIAPLLLVSTKQERYVQPVPVVVRLPIAIPARYRATIEREAGNAGIPVDILARVIHAESEWNPISTNINKNGTIDSGIAQLNSAYIEYFEWKFNDGNTINAYDPDMSIKIAARILAANHRLTGNWIEAVAAYNCGATRASRKPWPTTTQVYINSIFPPVAQ
jgi:soluble lytic murein transglycosylase-like protein